MDGCGNELVTVFANHTRTIIMTKSAKAPRRVMADGATSVYSLNRQAFMLKPQHVTGQIRKD